MSIDKVLEKLGIKETTDIADAAGLFLAQVKELMYSVQKSPDDKRAEQEATLVIHLYKSFFEYSVVWAETEKKRHEEAKDYAGAEKLKQKAADALSDMQANIIQFVLCYLSLSRSIGFVKEEMEQFEKAHGAQGKAIKWTNDTGVLLLRYRKEKYQLIDSNNILSEGMKVLSGAEKHVVSMTSNTEKLFGPKSSDEMMRSFMAGLRIKDYTRAKKALKTIVDTKRKFAFDKSAGDKAVKEIQKSGETFIDIVKKAEDKITTNENKLFLRASEADMVINSQIREIEQKNAFIEKYHQPYMENKLKRLQHLREKLVVVGSLESLTTLYIKMIRGMAQPLDDIKKVREYEEEVIGHIQHLLGGQFQEVENVKKRNVEEMAEFDESMEEYAKLEKEKGAS